MRSQDFRQILYEECRALDGGAPEFGACEEALGDLYKKNIAANRTALCLSGGGIRSAALSFGVIQRFAGIQLMARQGDRPKSLLAEFDYLSTVSGGGYIGSWLSAWLYRARVSKGPSVVDLLNYRDPTGREAHPIENLRQRALYLAPRTSMLSADIWNDLACVIRNLLLNWAVLLPPIALAVLLMQIGIVVFNILCETSASLRWGILALALAGLFCSFAYTATYIPTRGLGKAPILRFVTWDLVPWLVCSALLLAAVSARTSASIMIAGHAVSLPYLAALAVICGVVLFVAAWWAEPLLRLLQIAAPGGSRAFTLRVKDDRKRDRGPWSWVAAGLAFGGFSAGGIFLLTVTPWTSVERSIAILLLGLPYMVLARLVAECIFTAGSAELTASDVNFEWLSRAAGYFLLWSLIWILGVGLIGFGPHLLTMLHGYGKGVVFGGAGISGVVAALIGSSRQTGPLLQAATKARRYFTLDQLALLGAALFGLGLVLGFGKILDRLAFGDAFSHFKAASLRSPVLWGIFAGLLAVTLVASRFVSINRFSLHGLYRNRLVRTFLGASRPQSERDLTRDPFSDYDGHDNLLMRDLWPFPPGTEPQDPQDLEHPQSRVPGDWKPFHIVNMTVNLAASRNLAWQERKAASFTVSPLHAGCGSSCLAEGGAYCSTRYHGPDEGSYGGELGLTLGTAMAISGAAVNPNMGYYTSPGISFLMTLFNVRLGWWLANPANEKIDHSLTGPANSLLPLVREMFGLTSENSPWLLLSDGGHFDNTGLYEMVRRHCPFIVVVDGGGGCRMHLQRFGAVAGKNLGRSGRADRFQRFRSDQEEICRTADTRSRHTLLGSGGNPLQERQATRAAALHQGGASWHRARRCSQLWADTWHIPQRFPPSISSSRNCNSRLIGLWALRSPIRR